MAIAARTSSTEINAQVVNRFVGKTCEGILIDAAAVDYTPGVTDDVTFLASEVPIGTGGYQRQGISFSQADITAYNDAGVGIATKATVFSHDGGTASIDCSHAALVWTSNSITATTVLEAPTSGINGTYTNVPVTVTSGTGSGLVVDLTISNNGANAGNWVITIKNPGKDYEIGDVFTFSDSYLASIDAIAPGEGNLSYEVDNIAINPDGGSLISVAKTAAPLQVSGGNQAVFYWNIKLYQLSSSLA